VLSRCANTLNCKIPSILLINSWVAPSSSWVMICSASCFMVNVAPFSNVYSKMDCADRVTLQISKKSKAVKYFMYSVLPSSIQAAKVVKKAFVAERSLVKINLSNPFVKAKSLCIFATGILRTNLQVSAIKKSIRKCPDRREHTSHQSERDETNMGSGNAWHPLTDEKYWPVEGQKEEKNYPYPLSRDTKNNDSIF